MNPSRGCCCSGGSPGDVVCCSEVSWCDTSTTPPANKYHRFGINVVFRNHYDYKVSWSESVPAGVDCVPSGGPYPATITTSQSGKLGNIGGLASRSTFPCGVSTDCKNGLTIPDTDPAETVPGSCTQNAEGYYCSNTCLPYDWETCCITDQNSQPNCGDISLSGLNVFQDEFSFGTARFTVKANDAKTAITAGGSQTYGCTDCGGCIGFVQDQAPSSIVPASYYITTSNNQNVQWTGGDSGCDSGYICKSQTLRFWCADSVAAYVRTSAPTDYRFRYFSALGIFSHDPPSDSRIPYIALSDYPGSIVAVLYIDHEAVLEDQLLIDNGWGSCGWADRSTYRAQDVGCSVGYVAPCGASEYKFQPFGSVGILSQDGTMASYVSASGFTIPHDPDDWTD